MRDLGVLFGTVLPQDVLHDLLNHYGAKKRRVVSHTPTESVIGDDEDVLYVSNLEPKNNAFHDDGERKEIESKLGTVLRAYVSIHYGPGPEASELAVELAHEMTQRWGGLLDYSGMGGGLGVPPTDSRI